MRIGIVMFSHLDVVQDVEKVSGVHVNLAIAVSKQVHASVVLTQEQLNVQRCDVRVGE